MHSRLLVPIALAAAALSGCAQKQDDVLIENAWIRLPATPSAPAAAFFTIKGGVNPVALVSVACDQAIRTEMHESMMHDGMMTMAPIHDVAIPARSTVKFEPGGKHVMIFDLNTNLKPGMTAPLLFTFSNGQRYTIRAKTVAPAG